MWWLEKTEVPPRCLPIPAREARQHFSRLLNTARGGHRIAITKNDEPQAVMVSINDLHLLDWLDRDPEIKKLFDPDRKLTRAELLAELDTLISSDKKNAPP